MLHAALLASYDDWKIPAGRVFRVYFTLLHTNGCHISYVIFETDKLLFFSLICFGVYMCMSFFLELLFWTSGLANFLF